VGSVGTLKCTDGLRCKQIHFEDRVSSSLAFERYVFFSQEESVMRSVLVTLSLAVMAIGMLYVSSASAKARKVDHLSHTGTFVSAANGKLVMTGRNGKEHTHAVAKDVKVMIDGKAGALPGLTKGTHISVTTDKTGNVTAVTALAAPVVKATTAAKPGIPAPASAPIVTHPANNTPTATPAATHSK
jgi:hypothetical protein